MKTSEKIISAIVTIAIGVLLLVMKKELIGAFMTVIGISIMVLGLLDLFYRLIPPAVVKLVTGALIILCGRVVVEAVLYIVAAILLIVGILMLYDKIRKRSLHWASMCELFFDRISLIFNFCASNEKIE